MSQVLTQDLQRQLERLADEKMRLKTRLKTAPHLLLQDEKLQLEQQIASYTKAMLHLSNQKVQMTAVENLAVDQESRFCSKVVCWQQRPCLLHDIPFLGRILAGQPEYDFPALSPAQHRKEAEEEEEPRPALTRVLSKPIDIERMLNDFSPLPLSTVFALHAPLSKTARSIGARWLNNSGGKVLMEYERECGVRYADYVRDKSEVSAFDQEQINKDMARTRPRGLTVLSYRAWCAQMHEQSTCAALRRLVTCFTKRFHQIGYPQGIDHISMFLLGFMTEEEAFWTLCAITESIRDRDYYSPPPSSLNGFLVQRKLFVTFATRRFPSLVQACPKEDFFNALVAISARWFLIAFVGLVEFYSSVLIFDAFLGKEGEYALLRVGCALIELSESDIIESQEPLPTLLLATASLTPQQVQAALTNSRYDMSVEKRKAKTAKYRQEIAQQWSSVKGSKLDALAVYAGFSNGQIATMQKLFSEVSKSNKGEGLTEEQFKRLIEQTCPGVDFMAPDFLTHLFKLCDSDNNGKIDFREMICCLSLLWKGNLENKLRMCFDCYDTNRDGFLSYEDVCVMSLWLQQLYVSESDAQVDDDSKRKQYEEKFRMMDVDSDGKVTFAEFKAFIENDPFMSQAFVRVQDPSIECNKQTIHQIRGDKHWLGRLDVSFKGIFRGVKNLTLQYSDVEIRVREATQNIETPAPTTLMQDIAEASFKKGACEELVTVLWKRLKDETRYLHVQKSLQLIEYLLRYGSERLVTAFKSRKQDLLKLKDYRAFNSEGLDMGQLCREKALYLGHLLEEEGSARLVELRLEGRRTRARIDGSLASYGSASSLRPDESVRSQTKPRSSSEVLDDPEFGHCALDGDDAFADFPFDGGEENTEFEPLPMGVEMGREDSTQPKHADDSNTNSFVMHVVQFKDDPLI